MMVLRTSTDKVALVIIVACAALQLFAAVSGSRPYIDDLSRVIDGYTGYMKVGRPLAEVLMLIVNFGSPLVDLSPLPQLLGISVVAFSCYILFDRAASGYVPGITGAAASALLLVSPFQLQNFAYKFDSLAMAVSIGAAVMAALPGSGRVFWSGLGATAWLIALQCLYPESLGTFVSLTMLFFVINVAVGGDAPTSLRYAAEKLVALMVGAVLYRFAIVPFLVGGLLPVEQLAQNSLTAVVGFPTTLVGFVDHVVTGFRPLPLAILVTPCLVALVYTLYLAVRFPSQATPLIVALILAFLAPALAISGSQSVEPQALIGFGGLLVFCAMLTAFAFQEIAFLFSGVAKAGVRFVGAVVVVAPLLLCLTIGASFGVAQREQAAFDEEIAREVGSALRRTGAKASDKLAVAGVMPYHPRAQIQVAKFPIIRELVPRYLANDWWWGHPFLRYYGFEFARPTAAEREAMLAQTSTISPSYLGEVYSVRKVAGGFVLSFP